MFSSLWKHKYRVKSPLLLSEEVGGEMVKLKEIDTHALQSFTFVMFIKGENNEPQ